MIRLLLITSIAACLISLLRSSLRSKYYLTALYLLVAIPATVAFQSDAAWLRSWYAILVSPVALLRFAAGVEVAHRQAEGFRWWWLLMIGVFLTPVLFTGIAWVRSPHPSPLQEFVEVRRMIQIYMAGVFICLEAFWATQGGGWMVRPKDRIAVVFGFLLLSHGAVSVAMGISHLTGDEWREIQPRLWVLDALCYSWLTVLFAGARRSAPRYRNAAPVTFLSPRSPHDPNELSSSKR